MKKIILFFIAFSLLIFTVMISGCAERGVKSYAHCGKICSAMKENNDEEFLRLISNTKFNLNQYGSSPIVDFFEAIRRTPLQEACYLEKPYYKYIYLMKWRKRYEGKRDRRTIRGTDSSN